MKVLFSLLSICLTFSALSQNSENEALLRKKAEELAHRFIIVDGHVDFPYRLKAEGFQPTKEFAAIPIESDKGDFDYTRAKKGGLSSPFMSIFIAPSFQIKGGAKEEADSLIDIVNGLIKLHPDKFAPGLSPARILQNFKQGKISLPMGMENGAPLMELSDVAYFHRRGIRYVTLTHATDNQICDSSYDTTRTWNGLSAYGEEVVLELNRQGIMVDISHVSDAAFYQAVGISKAPVIASHSSCREFTPGFIRNMNDDMIKTLGRNGGVMMITFGSDFLDGTVSQNRKDMQAELKAILNGMNLDENSPEARPFVESFKKNYPRPLYSTVQMAADHVEHAVKLIGVDHVGFGSDFDGVGDSLPVGLKDAADYPNLIYELLKRGYSEEDIEKMCYKNLFRVWNEVENVAAKMQER